MPLGVSQRDSRFPWLHRPPLVPLDGDGCIAEMTWLELNFDAMFSPRHTLIATGFPPNRSHPVVRLDESFVMFQYQLCRR